MYKNIKMSLLQIYLSELIGKYTNMNKFVKKELVYWEIYMNWWTDEPRQSNKHVCCVCANEQMHPDEPMYKWMDWWTDIVCDV